MIQQKKTWLLTDAQKAQQSITYDWQFTDQNLIEGVQIKEIRPVPTSYGYLTEVLRTDWLRENKSVGQIFQSWIAPGAVSAWHAHEVTTDRLFVSQGMMKVVLYDNRSDAPTRGLINQFRFGTVRPALVVVPPKVWHGVQNVGPNPAILINAVDRAYQYKDPDHWLVPSTSPEIPFKFNDEP